MHACRRRGRATYCLIPIYCTYIYHTSITTSSLRLRSHSLLKYRLLPHSMQRSLCKMLFFDALYHLHCVCGFVRELNGLHYTKATREQVRADIRMMMMMIQRVEREDGIVERLAYCVFSRCYICRFFYGYIRE